MGKRSFTRCQALEKVPRDETCNVTATIESKIGRGLHIYEKNATHPLALLNERLTEIFRSQYPALERMDKHFLSPVVTLQENFDDLLIPRNHPSRSPSDTYYLNKSTLLRTHTSAHQTSVLRRLQGNMFLLTADVYRRDEVNASHYPVFHQTEGARLFNKGHIVEQTAEFWTGREKEDVICDSPSNPMQAAHRPHAKEVAAVARHLKASLNGMAQRLFSVNPGEKEIPIRWVDAYFPFTSPSWELEIWYNGEWLEVAGCGIMQQDILKKTGHDDKIGWAFGLGLERLAMVLFNIPDIRLFWTLDERFSSQFEAGGMQTKFKPYSKHPSCYKDVSFWLPSTGLQLHENDLSDLVRSIAGDFVEDVRLIDTFSNPKTQLKSQCYRINYRSMERNLSNEEVNCWQNELTKSLIEKYNVKLR